MPDTELNYGGKPLIYKDEGLRKIEFVWGDNSRRPLDMAELLEAAARSLRHIYDAEAPASSPKQPFLVDSVVVDVGNGAVAFYLARNE